MGQNPARGRSICGRISQPSVKYRQYLAWVKAIRQVASAMRSFAVRTAATRYWHHQSASHALYRCRLSLQSADTADCSSVCVHVYLLIMTVCPAQTVEPIEGDSNHVLYWFLDLTTGRGTLERETRQVVGIVQMTDNRIAHGYAFCWPLVISNVIIIAIATIIIQWVLLCPTKLHVHTWRLICVDRMGCCLSTCRFCIVHI